MRPVYNRPEMLELSLEYEIKAREYFSFSEDLVTLFIIEAGSHPKTLSLIENYPYKFSYIAREDKLGLTMNILEGFKVAFANTDDFVIYVEDDVLVHKTYFEYMNVLLNHPDIDKFSILSAYNHDDGGSVNDVYRGHHYAALAPLISRKFYMDYILPQSTLKYYVNRSQMVLKLNEKYKEHWGKGYKYKDATHNEQAGMINRLVDACMIDGNGHVIMPRVNRQQHIGYFGKNRPGGVIPGRTYEERLTNLRQVILDKNRMYDLSATKQYNDYKTFSPKLDDWDGTINVT